MFLLLEYYIIFFVFAISERLRITNYMEKKYLTSFHLPVTFTSHREIPFKSQPKRA